MTTPKWISLHEAREITGHDTVSGLDQFIRRWNLKHLDSLILRLPRRVDEVTLKAAIRQEVERCTPGMAALRTYQKTMLEKRRKQRGDNRQKGHEA